MIRKPLDDFSGSDKFALAGRRAEERMAFYLKRFFEFDETIHVFNGLRLERDGDAAQMDHLVVHPYGLVIVESKNVAGKIEIKDDGQWLRWYGTESRGMASPITQTRLQIAFLRNELARATGRPDLIQQMPINLLVSISDDGEIIWPKSGAVAEVCKADQVADKIQARVAELAAAKSLPWFAGANLNKIGDFFLKAHKPKPVRPAKPAAKPQTKADSQTQAAKPVKARPVPTPTPAPTSTPFPSVKPAAEPRPSVETAPKPSVTHPAGPSSRKRQCFKCNSENVEIRYGHSYYFRCLDCSNNFPIKAKCPTCSGPAPLRKQGRQFFRECPACKTSLLYFVNPEPQPGAAKKPDAKASATTSGPGTAPAGAKNAG